MDQFEALLSELKMSKARFAEIAGVTPTTVSRWKVPPRWALALLGLMVQVRRLAAQCA